MLKNNEKPENNTRDLSIGYLLVALTYSIIGSLFFLTFPDNKGSDDNVNWKQKVEFFQQNLNCHLNIRLYRSKCFGKSSEEWSHGNYRSILSISPNGNSFSASYIYIPCAVLVCYFQSQRLSRIPLRTGPQCDNNHTLHNCCHSISKGSY